MQNAKPLFQVSKKQVDMAQAKAIVKLSKKVNRLVKANYVDSHFIDVAQTLTPGTAATIGYLTPISQGDGEQQRDGDAITLRHLSWSATLVPNASSASDAFRIILFRWKTATVGTAPSPSAILDVPTNIDSPFNRDYRDSLVVLYDKKVDCSNVNGTKHLKLKTRLNNVCATFTGFSAANYNENQIFYLYLATDNTNKASINYYSRITFSP